jgi:outer membrane protein assembly factor BamE
MRHFLITALLLSLVAGCSSVNFGPHRIDVQQGNALDQENVARIKIGLNRSQVRFLLGTPLLVDPFRNDRWDYVYMNYKAGRLTEQRHLTLFFDGDTLARIEGDLPVTKPADQLPATVPDVQPTTKNETSTMSSAEETRPIPAPLTAQTAPVPAEVEASPVAATRSQPVRDVTPPETKSEAIAVPAVAAEAVPVSQSSQASTTGTSIVAPLPSPINAPAYVESHPSAEVSLQPETDVANIQPDVIPSFPVTAAVTAGGDALVLKSVKEWADAWARRDSAAYFSAYDERFVPQDGLSRAKWEQNKRQAMKMAKSIEVKVDSPSVDLAEEGTATVTFKQFYRSGSYHDAVLKQLLMVQHDGRWLIVEEKMLSNLHDPKP